MRKLAWFFLLALCGGLLFGCGQKAAPEKKPVAQPPVTQQPPSQTSLPPTEGVPMLTVSSSAFLNNEMIPKRYTADGEGVSPDLTWTAPPATAKETVLIMFDPDAPRGTYYHWTVFDLSPTTTSLPENLPKTPTPSEVKASQGLNSANTVGYTPPSPPPGKVHHYHFAVYALREPSGLPAQATPREVQQAVKDRIIAQGELIGTYQR